MENKKLNTLIISAIILIVLASFIVNSENSDPSIEGLGENKVETANQNTESGESISQGDAPQTPNAVPVESGAAEIKDIQNFEEDTDKEDTPEEKAEYINIEELKQEETATENTGEQPNNEGVNETETTNNQNKSDANQTEYLPMMLYQNGKAEINTTMDFPPNIKKVETINEKGNKEVIISSEEHINEEITAYTSIPEISKEETNSVKVIWVNENRSEVEIKEFIDSNDNNQYDQISWVVPHLSEQTFEIIINFRTGSSSDSIEIDADKCPRGETSNPIEFNFSINYSQPENLSCFLELNKQGEGEHPNRIDLNISNNRTSINNSLENGNYQWYLECNAPNNSINKSGNFTVNENFSVSVSKRVYLLDGAGNLIGGVGNLQINSTKATNMSIKINKPSLQAYEENFSGNYRAITLDNNIIKEKGNYSINITFKRLAKPISIEKDFAVAKAELSFNKYEAVINEEVTIKADLYAPAGKIKSVILAFGDGSSNIDYVLAEFNSKTIEFKHKYAQSGNYTTTLNMSVEGSNQLFEVRKNGIYVKNSQDTTKPAITLIYPGSNEEIKEDTITFSYKAEDNVKIKNCTFELYNYTTGIGTLDYSKKQEDLENNKTIEIALKDFETGKYSWNVYCCDNSSNCNNDLDYYRKFNVSLNSSTTSSTNETMADYEKKEELDYLITKIEEFIQKQSSYGAEEKEALEDLGITKDLDTDLKILKQIDQDLGYHVSLIKDEALRKKTIKEKEDQIEEIKGKVPLDMKILGKHEFVKNSLAKNMKSIVQDYIDSKGIKANSKTVKRLTELNSDIQNYIVVSTGVKQIEISYFNYTSEITLITKKIEIKNDTFNTLLEVVPKEVIENASEITFLTKNEVIKEDPIFAVSVDDLKNERIVYYINKSIDLKKIEDTETIIFKEFAINTKITGFFILDLENTSLIYYILLIFLVIVVAYLVWFYLRKRKIAQWKKEENVIRIFAYIKEANRALEKKDVIVAKENYHKIQEVYPLIPEGCRRYLLKKIKYIRMEIDKKEILALVKEFEAAKAEKRKEDADFLYKKIQPIYKRLPKKYREKVHEKLVI